MTDLEPGTFLARVFLPYADTGSEPLALEFARLHAPAGNWALGVLTNTADSPGRHGPMGDALLEVVDGPPTLFSEELGDYGLYVHTPSQSGFAWGNVDRAGLYGFGPALCPSDCAPFAGNGRVGSEDLLAVLGGWGLAGASSACDLDRNDVVDFDDLERALGDWGTCGLLRSTEAPGRRASGHVSGYESAALAEAIAAAAAEPAAARTRTLLDVLARWCVDGEE